MLGFDGIFVRSGFFKVLFSLVLLPADFNLDAVYLGGDKIVNFVFDIYVMGDYDLLADDLSKFLKLFWVMF
jgi:hypothetical protein